MNSLARSREYINCLKGFPVPDTTNGVPFSVGESNSMAFAMFEQEDNDFLRGSIYELSQE